MRERLSGTEGILRRVASVVGTLEWSVPFPSVLQSGRCRGLESRIAVSLAGCNKVPRKEPYA